MEISTLLLPTSSVVPANKQLLPHPYDPALQEKLFNWIRLVEAGPDGIY
jgi:hypothetical protein